MSVVIETTIGDITVDLFTEERPIACLNFLKLCRLKYYNFNLFHTIERGFIAQTGDPTGEGNGGCSIWGIVEGAHKRFFEAESLPKIYHSSAGLLSLVSAGKNLVASQFIFTLGDNLASLDGIHCVIGEVVEGHETLRKLNEAIVDDAFRPFQDIRITHTVILDDPFPNPRGFQIPKRSPSPSAERLKNGRIAADEDIDDTEGKTMEEIQEMLAEREAKARATILEIVGDIPDVDVAPPENVLFVCKLNPVTTDDDLEIIFSRFGKVKGCEVIRDRKTGDSLQYAFVEFEEQKSCEAAYFKMDNVLIDDRRIHVDFSQSVAKVKWRGKGRGVEGAQGRLDFNNLRESGGGDRERNRNGKFHERRERMTSEERRKAREERHREQEKSTSRSNVRRDERQYYERSHDYDRNKRREQSPGRGDRRRLDYRVDRRDEQRRRFKSRSVSRERAAERRSAKKRSRSPTERRNDSALKLKRHGQDTGRNIDVEPHLYHSQTTNSTNDKKSKKKKSKHVSSEETSETSSLSSSETTSSSSDSDSDSSSASERKRKRKTKKSKKRKSAAKKKTKKRRK